MKKIKIRILLITFLLLVLISTFSNATYNTVTMSVVEEPICTINFGTNSSVERKVLSKDLDNKEIILQLTVKNNEEKLKPTGEIMLVIDNSNSMSDMVTDEKSREDIVIDSAKNLITKLLEDNTKLKIGIVSFSTKSTTEEGIPEDAKLISKLSNDTKQLISSVNNIKYDGPRTNLNAGIDLAKQQFTDETDKDHKYVIVLSDGVPNVAINFDNYYYSDDVISKTKKSLQSLSTISDNVIVMLTGITNGDALPTYVPAYTGTKRTYNEIIEEIFGTTQEPTIGKFYYITDEKIEETIKNNIYNDLLPTSKSINNIKVVDSFPKEIVNNFEFSYVKEANIGTISPTIDKTTNSITWTIPELKSGETAIVQYKLKLNTKYDENIVNKILDTNTKLDITYTDNSGKEDSKTSNIVPKIKLTEPTPQEIKKDEETRPTVLPKAGKVIFIGVIGLALVITIILGIRYFIIKNKTK